jgi:hypothetical protein
LDKDFYYIDVALHDKKQFSIVLFLNQLCLNLFVFWAKGMCLKHICKYRHGTNLQGLKSKQWSLDSEFSEFEYSPKNCHFWRVLEFAKMVFFGNVPDSPDSPTFANLFCSDSPDSNSPKYLHDILRVLRVLQKCTLLSVYIERERETKAS